MSHDAHARIATRLFPRSTLERVERLTGGVSAEVHRLDLTLHNGNAVSLVVRAHGATHSGHSAEREFQLLQALHRGGLAVPKPLLVDDSLTLLPVPFLVIEFIRGSTRIPAARQDLYIDRMAAGIAAIHAQPTAKLPQLPERRDPLPEVFDFIPEEHQWGSLLADLRSLSGTRYAGAPKLLHGDFWPENLLWQEGAIAAILDWEDAAIGDPLSDVAGCRVELRYKFGPASMERFTRAYAKYHPVDGNRLALWQLYVAAAAAKFMGNWGLDPELEAHMRIEAQASMREAATIISRPATR